MMVMKILVFSDSHSAISFMRLCAEAVKPDGLIHLGDHYDDGEVLKEEYPHIRLWQVPGNCDRYRVPGFVPEILIQPVFGVDMYMTHGHKHGVKMGIGALIRDARLCKCQIALYGHTHVKDCHQEADGLWVLNPGASGFNGGSAGLIEIQNNKIKTCRIIDRWDLEEMK
jgi:putative phosphoesterase